MEIRNWNSLEHSDEENLSWSWFRAVEWAYWPLLISGPIIPVLLIFFEWWKIIGIVAILTWLWFFIRYKYVNLSMANFGVYFVRLKWVTCSMVAIYFVIRYNYTLAMVSFFWPLLDQLYRAYLENITGDAQIGKIQKMFMVKLGCKESVEN